jgi:hypothetical protein
MKATAKILLGENQSPTLFAIKPSEDPNKLYDVLGEIPQILDREIKEGDEIEGEIDYLSTPIEPGGEIIKSFFIPNKKIY